MKRINLILLFSLLLIYCQGQNIVQEGKLWSNSEIGTMVGSTYKSYFVKFETDTFVNGIQYKKIMKSFDESHSTWVEDGFIREEPATQRVFMYTKGYPSELLLYDFSLEEGDSISILNDDFYYKVEKVVYAPFGNSNEIRKQIYFNNGALIPVWVEGIGNVWMGVLTQYGLLTGADLNMVCFFENDQLVYHDPHSSTCFPKGYYSNVESIQKASAVNLTYKTDQVLFTFNEAGTSNSILQLFNMRGEKIMESPLNGRSQQSIPTNCLSPGMYIYRFKNNGINSSGKLFIK